MKNTATTTQLQGLFQEEMFDMWCKTQPAELNEETSAEVWENAFRTAITQAGKDATQAISKAGTDASFNDITTENKALRNLVQLYAFQTGIDILKQQEFVDIELAAWEGKFSVEAPRKPDWIAIGEPGWEDGKLKRRVINSLRSRVWPRITQEAGFRKNANAYLFKSEV